MARRTYGQLCGIASALDLLGERWTLLLVRELLTGPQRFGELLANLPGVGPNLLSERLQALTADGVVESEPLTDDKRGRRYRLTPLGEELRDPLLQLGRWGMARLEPDRFVEARAHWGLIAVEAMMRGRPVEGPAEAYEFRIDDLVFHVRVADGAATLHRGAAEAPSMVATTDSRTFVTIGGGLVTPFEAVATGRLVLEGDPDAVLRCSRLLGLL
ncbi:winged helix-turn-helix transcriptional regulator [Streptomyces sp. HPF1205]|uniref:winged helix-turn-helix transcriptional regulator n=1 Tax=Streptomyces sp. HPF1205 TaxID=2873262 RepID=UPI001CEC73D2|nr:winged helix-turn-helix transcriptional regulator [Streptomyces sp. HPF1205]